MCSGIFVCCFFLSLYLRFLVGLAVREAVERRAESRVVRRTKAGRRTGRQSGGGPGGRGRLAAEQYPSPRAVRTPCGAMRARHGQRRMISRTCAAPRDLCGNVCHQQVWLSRCAVWGHIKRAPCGDMNHSSRRFHHFAVHRWGTLVYLFADVRMRKISWLHYLTISAIVILEKNSSDIFFFSQRGFGRFLPITSVSK